MTYALKFTIDGLEFTTTRIQSETEMHQKREKLSSIADEVEVLEYAI